MFILFLILLFLVRISASEPISNELRIFEGIELKELFTFDHCVNNVDLIKEFTLEGKMISLSSLLSEKSNNLSIEPLIGSHNKKIILLIDDLIVERKKVINFILSNSKYFSMIICDNDYYNSTELRKLDYICSLNKKSISNLLLYQKEKFVFEYHHSQFLFDENFVYYASFILMIISLINFLPKIYFLILSINDPFQKIFFLSYIVNVLLCVLVFFEARLHYEFYQKYKMPPEKGYFYYLINNVDSLLKTYTMVICVSLSNGLFFSFRFKSRKCGNYICQIAVLYCIFAMDLVAKKLFNRTKNKIVKEFLEMCLELKELIVFTFLIHISTKQINHLEMQIMKKILFASSISNKNRDKIRIKMHYLKKQKLSLLIYLLLFCFMVIFEKSAFIHYMNGIVILIMKMMGNQLLFLLLK